MLTILYTLIIQPIEIIYELIFAVAQNIFKENIILSILFLSLAVNILSLPLYKRADKLQEKNKAKQQAMDRMTGHIRKTFKGDERFMMLQTYYRQNDYKPVHALRGAISLFLQVPFFIAAYRFLSELQILKESSFGIITNLGAPDALITFGAFSVNFLPILMTLINIVSGAIYTRGDSVKTKVQLYGIALVFLVLLYDSPSGLVLYWTFNNVFSLFKNIFEKLIFGKIKMFEKNIKEEKSIQISKRERLTFWIGALFLTVFTGCYIPGSIISSSPAEFVDMFNKQSPLVYVGFSLLLATGTFIVWLGIYYLLSEDKVRVIFGRALFVISVIAVINYAFLGTKLGLIRSTLQYEEEAIFLDFGLKMLNLLTDIVLAVALYFACVKFKKITNEILAVGIVTVMVFVVMNTYKTGAEYKNILKADSVNVSGEMTIPLSRDGQNVMILFLDRAMGTQLPYILNEKPELKEAFDGFTYYPNTVSFGGCTNFCSPAVYAGYEYTPWNLNEDDSRLLAEKNDEALKVLPVLFNQNDFEITISDPPYAGYGWNPDLSIYDDYPDINAYITEAKYTTGIGETNERTEYIRKRNFFCNSVMRISPLIAWKKMYDNGYYNCSDTMDIQVADGLSKAYGYNRAFLNWYYVLDNLENMSVVLEGESNTFLYLYNATPHEMAMLQQPDYTPELSIDNTEFDTDMISRYTIDGRTMDMTEISQIMSYDANMAALLKLANWFDWMRENDVYDNTRIIIVSDHGGPRNQFDLVTDEGVDVESYLPLLMMKDFDQNGFSVSDEFMTNADGVIFAVSDIIENPVNPFTGNVLDGHEKYEDDIRVTTSLEYDTLTNNGYRFIPGEWYTVHDNPYDMNNWEYIGEY